MLKTKIMKQAMELYSLGVKAEAARQILSVYVDKYGLTAPVTIKQVEKVEQLLDQFSELEKRHIADTENIPSLKGSHIH